MKVLPLMSTSPLMKSPDDITMNIRADNPGSACQPTVFYTAPVVAGWLPNPRWPLAVGGGTSRSSAAARFVAACAVLTLSSVGLFRRNQIWR
jgi:hypothetical protein